MRSKAKKTLVRFPTQTIPSVLAASARMSAARISSQFIDSAAFSVIPSHRESRSHHKAGQTEVIAAIQRFAARAAVPKYDRCS
jgi:hypothetical protein